jgi:hypothetical protein
MPFDVNMIARDFYTRWVYFRMRKNPALTYEETHDKYGHWKNPYDLLLPSDFSQYRKQIKIRHWYPDYQQYNSELKAVFIHDTSFYVIEKDNGITGIKWKIFWDSIGVPAIPIDTMHVNVYDSLFLYDNRFLAYHAIEGNRILFCSGNVSWDHPMNHRELSWLEGIERIGYIRGVQFNVEFVRKIKEAQLEEIRRLRPAYPNYVYASGYRSSFCYGQILIGAPEGKEVDLIEYIFYSNDPVKTKDPDTNNIYEMRYVVPSEIKTISERRMERRKLPPEEWEQIKNSYLYEFYDKWALLLKNNEKSDNGNEVENGDEVEEQIPYP